MEYVVSKCKEEPKMYYIFINGKLNRKETVVRLKLGGVIYEKDKDLA